MSRVRRVSRAMLAAIIWIGVAWTSFLLGTGGVDGRLIGIRITAHDARRPALWSALALSVFMLIGGEDLVLRGTRWLTQICRRAWQRLIALTVIRHLDRVAVIALSATVIVIGGFKGVKSVGGSDSYGYVSQADLWLSGHVTIAQPWVKDVPWPNAKAVATPLGYRSGPDRWLMEPPVPHRERDPWVLVPTYPPGFPLVLAGTKWLAGQSAMFLVPPICWGLLALATYGIGCRLGSRIGGLIAAWLVATSPNVMEMAQSMMCDVPVAAAWATAYWALLGTTMASGAGAAAALAIAILIRPNLVFMSAAVLLLVAHQIRVSRGPERRRQMIRGLIVVTGIGTASAAVATINWVVHGSPFASGYGSLSEVMRWQYVLPNVTIYTQWFVKVHSVFALAGIAALFLPLRWLWPGVRHRTIVLYLGVFVAGVWVEYMTAGIFETEFYLRYLLPTWPFIMLGIAQTLLVPSGFGPVWFKRTITVAALVVATQWGWSYVPRAIGDGPFTPLTGEAKYNTAGYYARKFTPENSAIFAMQHSGSIRYYAGRMTLRYDYLPAGWMDRSLSWLSEHGVHPFLLIEDWERPSFDSRFGAEAVQEALKRPPIFSFRGVLLYDLLPGADSTPTLEVPDRDAILDSMPPAPAPTLVFSRK